MNLKISHTTNAWYTLSQMSGPNTLNVLGLVPGTNDKYIVCITGLHLYIQFFSCVSGNDNTIFWRSDTAWIQLYNNIIHDHVYNALFVVNQLHLPCVNFNSNEWRQPLKCIPAGLYKHTIPFKSLNAFSPVDRLFILNLYRQLKKFNFTIITIMMLYKTKYKLLLFVFQLYLQLAIQTWNGRESESKSYNL